MDKIKVDFPTFYFRPKENKIGSPLALTNFLSHRSDGNQYFAENYVKELMLASKCFSSNLEVNKNQSNAECDIIDFEKNKQYEIKTLWGQRGCKLLDIIAFILSSLISYNKKANHRNLRLT